MKYYYTYVLQSLIDSSLYVGYTDNLESRLSQHNNGKVPSTSRKKPYKIIYCEACLIKADAISREQALKTGFGRAYIKRRISNLGR